MVCRSSSSLAKLLPLLHYVHVEAREEGVETKASSYMNRHLDVCKKAGRVDTHWMAFRLFIHLTAGKYLNKAIVNHHVDPSNSCCLDQDSLMGLGLPMVGMLFPFASFS